MASILVVDDEPDVRELFNITLKMAGHMTNTVNDGQEALDALAVELPDLILLDLMMPRVNGFEFLDAIREQRENEPLRVLVATAKVIEDAEQEKLSSWPVVGVLNKGELDIGRMVMIVAEALSEDPYRPNGLTT
jgi:CheY-like chemotaxis protein